MIEEALQRTDITSILQRLSLTSSSALIRAGSIVLSICLLSYFVITEVLRIRARLPNIGGPRGLPIVGNLHQLGPDPSERLRQWGEKYGGVYQIMMGNMPVVVFTSMKAAKEVFIGQGGALVDRPRFHTFHGVLSTVASTIGTTPWSESTKRRRKAAANAMNRPATASYIPLIDELSCDLIRDLIQSGKSGTVAFDPKASMQRSILDLTLTLNYGTKLPKNEELISELIQIEHQVAQLRASTGSSQDFVPILRWNPFSRKSAFARETNRRRLVYLNRFNRELEDRIKVHKDKPCIQGNVLKDPDAKLNDIELMSISMSMVSGGLDTMVHTIAWTIGVLAQRPDIQQTAYDAISNEYGSEIWGDAAEENRVPYVTALVKEALRYSSVLRLALPRAAWRDIDYEGVHVPQGTTVYLNVWGCNRDKSAYGQGVDDFDPERFFDSEKTSGREHATYGFGTRMCPAAHLANRQLYILLLRLIWAFKIELSADPRENQWTIRPVEDSTEPFNVAAIPPRYHVRFVPRNLAALSKLIGLD